MVEMDCRTGDVQRVERWRLGVDEMSLVEAVPGGVGEHLVDVVVVDAGFCRLLVLDVADGDDLAVIPATRGRE